MLRLLTVDITNTVVTMIAEIAPQDGDSGLNQKLENLMHSGNIKQFAGVMHDILDQLCETANVVRPAGKTEFINTIIGDIQENFADQNLNISALADRFALTPAYLSKRFRDHTGESLLDFINHTRLQHVKRLLRQGNMSISQITSQVGFTNSNTLIRIFKKYESMTPGQYRELSYRGHALEEDELEC